MNIFLFYLLAQICVRDRQCLGVLDWKISDEYRAKLPITVHYLYTLITLGFALMLDSFSVISLWYFFMFLGVGEYGMQYSWIFYNKDTQYTMNSDQILGLILPFIILFAPSVLQLFLHLAVVFVIATPSTEYLDDEIKAD
jgi:hypothetical protein